MKILIGLGLCLAANLMLVDCLSQEEARTIGILIPGFEYCTIGIPENRITINATDKCCEAHHTCDRIDPLQTSNDLFNPTILPRYECNCEAKLMKCLQDAGDVASTILGQAYFALVNQCYSKDYPVIECLTWQNEIFGKRCKNYKFDKTKEKTYQFFDLPFYSSKSVK